MAPPWTVEEVGELHHRFGHFPDYDSFIHHYPNGSWWGTLPETIQSKRKEKRSVRQRIKRCFENNCEWILMMM